jgi:hypothetical protein
MLCPSLQLFSCCLFTNMWNRCSETLIDGARLEPQASTWYGAEWCSWLWLDYVHNGNTTSLGGLQLSWQPPLNDRATNWRLGVRGEEVHWDQPRRYSNFTCRTAGLFNYPLWGLQSLFVSTQANKRGWIIAVCMSYSWTLMLYKLISWQIMIIRNEVAPHLRNYTLFP